MRQALFYLANKQWGGKLVWVNRKASLPPEFTKLGNECFPHAMHWITRWYCDISKPASSPSS